MPNQLLSALGTTRFQPLSNLLLTCNGNLANILLIQGKRAEARPVYPLVQDARPIASGPDALVHIALEMAQCLVAPKATIGLAMPDSAFAANCAEETVRTVRLAVESGFNDFGRLRNEPALSTLRHHPESASLLAEPRPVKPSKR